MTLGFAAPTKENGMSIRSFRVFGLLVALGTMGLADNSLAQRLDTCRATVSDDVSYSVQDNGHTIVMTAHLDVSTPDDQRQVFVTFGGSYEAKAENLPQMSMTISDTETVIVKRGSSDATVRGRVFSGGWRIVDVSQVAVTDAKCYVGSQ